MLKLRLTRIGRKHDPSFRVVITESTAPARGKYLESVGFYNASLKQVQLNAERIKYWIEHGVQTTGVVHNLLVKEGVIEGAKVPVHSHKPSKKKAAKGAAEQKAPEGEKSATEDEAVVKEAPQEAQPEQVQEAPAKEETDEAPTPEAGRGPDPLRQSDSEASQSVGKKPAEEPKQEEPGEARTPEGEEDPGKNVEEEPKEQPQEPATEEESKKEGSEG